MQEKYPMTLETKKKLEEELEFLTKEKQMKVNEEVKYRRSFCDFSEDSAFKEAIAQQAMIKERIRLIEEMLSNLELIDLNAKTSSIVKLGSRVTIKEIPDGEEETYTIVGTIGADPLHYKISNDSPIGRSLMGRKKGQKVFITTPKGTTRVKILDVN